MSARAMRREPLTGGHDGETPRTPVRDLGAPVAGTGGADVAWGAGQAVDGAALVRDARAGDPQAFRRLVDTHYARALRFARNMGLAAEDAEEAVQDTFVRVWNALPRFRPDAPFEPWLFRILANRCRSALVRRRWWRRAAVQDAEDVLAQLPARWGAEGDPALYDEVRRALDGLPAEQREAFLLRHVEGLEYGEMMTVTGAGLSALKMRVKRASDALRARLQEAMA